MRSMLNLTQRIKCNSSGSISVIFAVMIVPILIFAGCGVDYGQVVSDRIKTQAALDAALLGAALAHLADGETRQSYATAHFNSIVSKSKSTETSKIITFIDSNGILKAMASNSTNTIFLGVIGMSKIEYSVSSEIQTNIKDAEVVMILDFSDSMIDNSKYQRMQSAASDLVDILSDNGASTNVKFGVVPFAALVHLDLDANDIRGDVTWDGCTQDRRGPANTTDNQPTGNDETKWGEVTSTHPCSDMAASNLKIVPLTTDVADVKNKLAAMEPYLWTHIALGAEFGWHLLSPKAPFKEAANFNNNKTIKIFILLTDGMQTAPGWGPDGTKTVAHAEDNLQAICDGMKSQNIRVYTIGYDLYDTNTLNGLKNCAGAEGKFFDEKDVNYGLEETFNQIGIEIKSDLIRITG